MSGITIRPAQSTFNFGDCVTAFLTQPGLPFASILAAERIRRVFALHGGLFGRIYSTAIVLWAFLGQVLRDGKEASCQSAVSRISSYFLLTRGVGVDPDTRDYCRARAKLPEAALRQLAGEIASNSEQEIDAKFLFKNRHAKLIDGSTFTMADTRANQESYPQHASQQPGIGFPIARFVVVVSLATACVIDAAIAKFQGKETGETALLRQLLHCFAAGDVAVADRFYGNYWVVAFLTLQGVDVCFRKHQKRPTDFRRGRRIGYKDHLITWSRPDRPEWMSEELYAQMPLTIRLREIQYVVERAGRKQSPFVVITTLFQEQGEQEFTYDEIADFYGFRWHAELDLRSIKTHMNLRHLRCKTPAMVHRQFWTTLIAYNAIRLTACCSATLSGVPPRRISFASTCEYVLAGWDLLSGVASIPAHALLQYSEERLMQIARCLVGNRPGRYEPRVLKKRQTNDGLMVQPRAVLKERLAHGDNSFETK
ncbi:IS4 family transposase [Lignipirellula cremea]|uniref:Transposase DDE domain protein n=1 Tax=Lignipirellula cremea TaxID=2528010 RepID=A0A518DQA3_9BACT|nr:IS4 family transposase [Lignipirellula cremea]QDU94020.1 Transposase DDE domain protein [Lignipirellula cremea]